MCGKQRKYHRLWDRRAWCHPIWSNDRSRSHTLSSTHPAPLVHRFATSLRKSANCSGECSNASENLHLAARNSIKARVEKVEKPVRDGRKLSLSIVLVVGTRRVTALFDRLGS